MCKSEIFRTLYPCLVEVLKVCLPTFANLKLYRKLLGGSDDSYKCDSNSIDGKGKRKGTFFIVIRRQKVLNALKWLKKFNTEYKDINISEEDLDWMGETDDHVLNEFILVFL